MKPTSRCGASGPTCTGEATRGATRSISPCRRPAAPRQRSGSWARPFEARRTGKSLPRSLPTKHRERQRVGKGKCESVRVDLGGRRIIQKKTNKRKKWTDNTQHVQYPDITYKLRTKHTNTNK